MWGLLAWGSEPCMPCLSALSKRLTEIAFEADVLGEDGAIRRGAESTRRVDAQLRNVAVRRAAARELLWRQKVVGQSRRLCRCSRFCGQLLQQPTGTERSRQAD